MSVKPLPSLRGHHPPRDTGRTVRCLRWFIDDWWIEVLLMIFIAGTMVYSHYT